MQRVAVAKYEDVRPGHMLGVDAAGTPVLVANVGGILYAVDGQCTHGKGRLAEGTLEGCIVKCPLHGAMFDIRTGEVRKPRRNAYGMLVGGPATANLRTYRVEEEGGQVFVEI
jgi:nitrite reductase/ring-hydroxylating ferredoxin subunit